MVAWAIKRFGGMIPLIDSRLLADGQADQAVNCDLSSGALESFSSPVEVHDFGGLSTARRAYRLPGPDDGDDDAWLELPSEHSSVVRSPLANDTHRRVYWTNPGDDTPWWNTYERIVDGLAPFNLGIVQPSTTVGPTVEVTGGEATAVSRSYVYTYVNDYGEESAPSAPSDVVSGAPDGTWTITGLTVPTEPLDKDYPPAVQLNLYRTVTGLQTGTQYFLVDTFVFATDPPPASYTDTTDDTTVVNNNTLDSTGWGNPPTGLDGLTALPGGMLVGFVDNTIHFCEPNRPHAWPAAYDQSLHYDIVGMGVWQQSLVVLTRGYPSTGSGNSPINYTFTQAQVAEPCIARGSIVTDMSGVYYASQTGLVRLSYYGMQLQTAKLLADDDWTEEYTAANIVACRHQAQYLAINGTGIGFVIDFSDERLGIVKLNTFDGATSIWNDEFTGDAYILADGKVYRWDDPDGDDLIYRWRSKQFYSPFPISLGACQICLDISVESAVAQETPPLDNGDSTLVLPNDVNAVFKLYAGQGEDVDRLVLTKNLTRHQEFFRLPSGFKEFDWQCEVISRVKIHSIEVASTMKELGRV